jgi:GNAT superfamily N-acetyltransferase
MDGKGANMSEPISIRPFNIREASQAEYAALNRHNNRIRRERLPDDPPIPLEEAIQGWQNIPPFVELKMWCAWDAGQAEIIAQGHVVLLHLETNRHITQFDLSVLPEQRRQDLGRRLLAQVTEAAQADGRRLMITETFDRQPGGEAFMHRFGAQKGLETHVNQLRITDLDRSLLERWLAQGQARGAEFELGLWDGPYPEEQLPAVVELVELTNQQPLGDLEIVEMHMTPERLRQSEQMLFARGSRRWRLSMLRRPAAGSPDTETVWNVTAQRSCARI